MPWASIGERAVLEPRTLVPLGTTLPAATHWAGAPCVQQKKESAPSAVTPAASTLALRAAGRTLAVVVHIASISGATYLAHNIVPAPAARARLETWTHDSLYLAFSYLCVLQVAGALLVAGSALLKWTFIAPYLTDRIAKSTQTPQSIT